MASNPPVPAAATGAPESPTTNTSSTGLGAIIEGPLALAAAVTAVLASTVGLLYVIGGTVMWLRFHEANLPADRAVALVPKDDLLILGLRVMVIPALLSGGFLVALGAIEWRSQEQRRAKLSRKKEQLETQLKEHEPGADDAAMRTRIAELEQEIAAHQQPLVTSDLLPRPRSQPIRFALLVGVALALVLVVPFSVGSLAWPIVLVGLLAYWPHVWSGRLEPGSRFPVWRLVLAAALGATTLSIARQTDRPVELLSVRVEVKSPSTLVRQTLDLHNAQRSERGRVASGEVSGILVAITGGDIAIGDPTNRVIATVPRSSVTAMTIGPPLDQRGPPASLLSRLLDDAGWAFTPLELWCENVRYGWDRIGHACRLAPSIKTTRDPLTIRKDHIRGITVACPASAEDGCRGFILVVTRRPVPDGANVLPLEFPAQPFAIDAGRSQPVLVPAEEDELFDQLTDEPSDQWRDVVIRLATEARGEAVVKRASAQLLVRAPTESKGKEKPNKKDEKKKRKKSAQSGQEQQQPGSQNQASQPNADGGDEGGDEQAEPSPTAAAEPPVEVTPTDSDPLPPQENTMPAPTPASVEPTS